MARWAASIFTDACTHSPQLVALYNDVAQYDKSIALIERVIKVNPSLYQAYVSLALTYYQTDRYDLAFETMAKAVAMSKSSC